MLRFLCLPLLLLNSSVFFDCGRALRCLLPVASGRFLHLVVLYGYQGADGDAERLSLTEQLFDAALGELWVVAFDQPCLLVGDFNVEPTKIPCLSKGILAGLWVDLESAWAFASGVPPAATCKRSWSDVGGHRRDFMIGCPMVAAAVHSCSVRMDRWIVPHLAVQASFLYSSWTCQVSQPVKRTPLWPASWLPALDKTRVLSLLRFKGFGRFMMKGFSLCLGKMLWGWMRRCFVVMSLVLG